MALKQNAVCIKHWYSQYYSMDTKLGRSLNRWRKKIKAFENKAHRRLLGINYRERKRISTLKRKLIHMLGSLRDCCQLS